MRALVGWHEAVVPALGCYDVGIVGTSIPELRPRMRHWRPRPDFPLPPGSDKHTHTHRHTHTASTNDQLRHSLNSPEKYNISVSFFKSILSPLPSSFALYSPPPPPLLSSPLSLR